MRVKPNIKRQAYAEVLRMQQICVAGAPRRRWEKEFQISRSQTIAL
jgi:hypothetical protein